MKGAPWSSRVGERFGRLTLLSVAVRQVPEHYECSCCGQLGHNARACQAVAA